jgi:hypothetical protein
MPVGVRARMRPRPSLDRLLDQGVSLEAVAACRAAEIPQGSGTSTASDSPEMGACQVAPGTSRTRVLDAVLDGLFEGVLGR